MSMYGCCQYYKIGGGSVNDSSAEQGNFMPLPNGEHINAQEKLKGSVHPDEIRAPGITSLIFQVIFQVVFTSKNFIACSCNSFVYIIFWFCLC